MQKKHIAWSIVAASVCIILLAVFLITSGGFRSDKLDCLPCSGLVSKLGQMCSKSEINQYKQYAVSTDSNVCAIAGKSILEENGNSIDAAISVLLCMGVTIPESLGLGGGSLIVIYNKTSNHSIFINAREMAPFASYRDMFNSSQSEPNDSHFGLHSIAVPGELAGYWHMFQKYGSKNVTWQRLFKHAIEFAENGFPVGQHLQDALEQYRDKIMKLKRLKMVYVNPTTNDLYKRDEILKQPQLAETLRNLSRSSDAHQYFYREIAKKIIHDLNFDNDFPNQKPYISLVDFAKYEVIEEKAYSSYITDNITLHTAKLPGSGILLAFIMKTMLHPRFKDLYPKARDDFDKAVLFYHRLMETLKFAYSRRMHLGDDRFDDCKDVIANLTSNDFINLIVSKINDSTTFPSEYYDAERFQPMDHGTAHVSVLDQHGNAVAVSSTINLYFGSKVISPSTGIILNDEMNDFNIGKTNEFGIPVSYSNSIRPYKRPLSSMSPSVFVDDTGPRLIIGASGGSKITTSVALVSLRHLWMNDDIKVAIDSSRLHHQLFPKNVENEPCFPDNILVELRKRNHEILELKKGVRGAVVMAISRSKNGIIEANSDFRKGGTIAGN